MVWHGMVICGLSEVVRGRRGGVVRCWSGEVVRW
jgi:hypothetical protein